MFNGIVGGGLAYRYVPPVGTDFVFLQVSDSGKSVVNAAGNGKALS